jgi:hypothetical protein
VRKGRGGNGHREEGRKELRKSVRKEGNKEGVKKRETEEGRVEVTACMAP